MNKVANIHKSHTSANFHRQLALDCALETFRIVSNFNGKEQSPNKQCQADLIKTKRDFVAEIKTILDPKERQQETRILIESVKRLARRTN